MEIKQVEKTKTVTVYVAEDGKEFPTEEMCKNYEACRERDHAIEWLRANSTNTGISSSLYAYITRDCPDNDMLELVPIVLTAEALEHLKAAGCCGEPDAPTGKLCFISIYDDADVYYEWGVDYLIVALAKNIANLAEYA